MRGCAVVGGTGGAGAATGEKRVLASHKLKTENNTPKQQERKIKHE